MKILLLCLTLFTLAGCLKTAEQIQREKRFENMSEQMKDSQGLVADLVATQKDMQAQMDKLNGRIEELEHTLKSFDPQALAKMQESVNLIQTQQQTSSQQLTQIQGELKEQRSFIEKVTATLAAKAAPSPKAQKKSAKTELTEGLDLIKRDKYAEARELLEPLIDSADLSAGDHNKVYYGLGKVEYYSKNHEKALVYFSKIYSKYPKASLAPSSLLFIGKSLAGLGKKDEATEAFKKVMEDYPGSKEAADAKKEL